MTAVEFLVLSATSTFLLWLAWHLWYDNDRPEETEEADACCDSTETD